MNTQNLQMTIDWAIQNAKAGKPIISDTIIPTLKEKGMVKLQANLAKRGIQVWWNQLEPNNVSIILPKCVETKTTTQEGWKVGLALGKDQVIMLPPMKQK
tara:strand:+ start:109 stop:408 length:300 start_codon:yes stop_codon:yes gene_type:complete